jgi:hypothetical protein
MIHLVFRFFSIAAVSLFLTVMDGCGDGGDDFNLDEGWKFPTTEKVIGPEGGTIEVTDTTSTVYGVKVKIPAGALAQETNIVIQSKWFASILPTGLTSDYPIVEFSPATTFLKDIQIALPVKSIPLGDDGKILSAFYWDPIKGKWIVIFPEQFIDSEMIIETNNFGLWRWGIVSLAEVETETVTSWMENLFGAWGDLQKAILDELIVPWSEVIQDPQNLLYCDTQDTIISQLSVIREVARQGVADYLTTNNVLSECPICTYHYPIFDPNPDCVASVCDPTELITGQPGLWAIKEYQIFWERIWVEGLASVLPGVPSELVGVYVAEARYLQAAKELNCNWRCMLEKGDSEFYVDLLLGNACSFSIFAIEFYRSHEGCITR